MNKKFIISLAYLYIFIAKSTIRFWNGLNRIDIRVSINCAFFADRNFHFARVGENFQIFAWVVSERTFLRFRKSLKHFYPLRTVSETNYEYIQDQQIRVLIAPFWFRAKLIVRKVSDTIYQRVYPNKRKIQNYEN